jgi:hypothetical protein
MVRRPRARLQARSACQIERNKHRRARVWNNAARMNARSWIVAACLSAQVVVPQAAFAQGKGGAPKAGAAGKADPKAEPTPQDKAKEFTKSGDKAAAAGEWEDAYADYSIAWSIYKGWETALGAGKAANKTGHHSEAVERLSLYLKEAPAKAVTAKGRIEVEAMLEDSKSKTGMLTIVGPEGGDVFLDRNPVGKTPLPAAIRVDPGKHEIEIRRGAAGETKSTEVTAGATVEVKFEPPKVAEPPKIIIKEDSYAWRTPALIAGSGLAFAGLALGGISLGLSFERTGAKQTAELEPDGEAAAKKAAEEAALFKNMMVWSFVGAGVALAATAVVFFVVKPSEKPRVQGAVGLGAGGPSLLLEGEF